MKRKTTISLLCLIVLSMGLLHRQNLLQATPIHPQQTSEKKPEPQTQLSQWRQSVDTLLDLTHQQQVWQRILDQNPKDAEAHHQLGLVLMNRNQIESAIHHYHQAIELAPTTSHRIYQSLGKAFVKQQKIDEAIAAFRDGISQGYPDAPKAMQDAEVYFRLGLALENENRGTDAIKAYRQAISLKPDSLINETLGNAFVQNNQPEEALQAFQRAFPNRKNNRYDYSLLGDALVQQNRPEEALAAYRKWIESLGETNSDVFALTRMATRLSLDGRVNEAIATYHTALELNSLDKRSVVKPLMTLLISQNQRADAQALSQKYFQSEQEYTSLLAKYSLQQAQTLLKAHQFEAAEQHCRQTLLLLSGEPEVWTCLGRVQSHQGQLEKALVSFQKAYQLANYQYSNVIATLIKLERPTEAFAVFKQNDSNTGYGSVRFGQELLELHQPQWAAKQCQTALTLDPKLAQGHLCLAEALRAQDQLQAANQHLETAGKLFQAEIAQIPDQVVSHAYTAKRLGNASIPYNIYETEKAQNILPQLHALQAYRGWGDVLMAQGKVTDAIAAYNESLRLLPEDGEIYLKLGQAFNQKEEYGSAIAAFRRGIQLYPYEANSYVGLSKALQGVNETKLSELAIQQAIQLGWKNTEREH